MSFQVLRYIVAAVKHRNFGLAAEACNVTQSTLSERIRKLEDYLDVPLFIRTSKGVKPTAAGIYVSILAEFALVVEGHIKALGKRAHTKA